MNWSCLHKQTRKETTPHSTDLTYNSRYNTPCNASKHAITNQEDYAFCMGLNVILVGCSMEKRE